METVAVLMTASGRPAAMYINADIARVRAAELNADPFVEPGNPDVDAPYYVEVWCVTGQEVRPKGGAGDATAGGSAASDAAAKTVTAGGPAPSLNECNRCRRPATASVSCEACSKRYGRCDEHGGAAGCKRSLQSHRALMGCDHWTDGR